MIGKLIANILGYGITLALVVLAAYHWLGYRLDEHPETAAVIMGALTYGYGFFDGWRGRD